MSQTGQFVYTAEHEFFYSTKDPVSISDTIEALQGLERMLRSLPRAIEKVTNVAIIDTQIFIEQLESGSLKERIFIKLFFGSEEELDAFLDKTRTTIDGRPMLKKTLIGALIVGLAGTGIFLASKAVQQPTPNITANHNVIMNFGAGEVGMTPEGFRSLIESSISDKRDFAKAAVKFVKPARADSDAAIIIDGLEHAEITSQAVAETPEKITFEPQLDVLELEEVTLLIRASDIDQYKSGWAGAVQGQTERLPIELDPAINPTQLAGRINKNVTADVAIVRRFDQRLRTMVPRSIFVRKIYESLH